jgi:hypothetical protein
LSSIESVCFTIAPVELSSWEECLSSSDIRRLLECTQNIVLAAYPPDVVLSFLHDCVWHSRGMFAFFSDSQKARAFIALGDMDVSLTQGALFATQLLYLFGLLSILSCSPQNVS